MKINIKLINVSDGDAIIVSLEKQKKSLLLLIDGGHTNDFALIRKELDTALSSLNKKGPDLLISTHYDSDHIGGLYQIVNHYGGSIGKILINETPTEVNSRRYTIGGGGILPGEDDLLLGEDGGLVFNDDDSLNAILESIRQERELSALIDALGVSREVPRHGLTIDPLWPEVMILGPTASFYQKLFPSKKLTLSDLKEDITLNDETEAIVTKGNDNPCLNLDKSSKWVSKVNLASTIILIQSGDHRFLFTGDAGIPSFQNIPQFEKQLKDIFWLKVPHHASCKNLNSALIKLMNPRYAAISGKRLVCEDLVNCLLSNGSIIQSTVDFPTSLEYNYEIR